MLTEVVGIVVGYYRIRVPIDPPGNDSASPRLKFFILFPGGDFLKIFVKKINKKKTYDFGVEI